MTMLLMVGDEAATAVTLTPDGVDIVDALVDEGLRSDLGVTATALGRLAEAETLLVDHEATRDVAEAARTLGESVLGEFRATADAVEGDEAVIFVDETSAVLVGVDGTATPLPLRAARGAAATLDVLVSGRTTTVSPEVTE